MRLLPVGFRSAEARKRIVLGSTHFPGHSGPGSDPESGQRAGLQLAPGSPEVYNSPPEAPKVNKSRPGGLQVAPRRPRRSANSPREVYNSPPEAPKVNKSRPGGLHIPPRRPRRSTSHAQAAPPPSPSLPAPCLEPPASEWPWRNSRSVNNYKVGNGVVVPRLIIVAPGVLEILHQFLDLRPRLRA